MSLLLSLSSGTVIFAQNERPIFETGAKVQSKKIAVGMKFWFVPDIGRKPILRIGFAKSTSYKDQRVETLLYPSEAVGLTIIGEHKRGTHIDSYHVRFDDGSTAFLKAFRLEMNLSDLEIERIQSSSQGRLQAERFYSQDPAGFAARRAELEAIEAEQNRMAMEAAQKAEAARKAQAKKAASERAKRGPVRIGMTKEQVLASSWGKPMRVIRDIRENVNYEQWIYPRGNYLHFNQGALTSIQTSN